MTHRIEISLGVGFRKIREHQGKAKRAATTGVADRRPNAASDHDLILFRSTGKLKPALGFAIRMTGLGRGREGGFRLR